MEREFVGRVEQRELLASRLADVRDGHARTVLVGGEAGVGKSRLVAMFAESARAAGAHVLTGACEEHFGDPMPYRPLLELLEIFGREHGRQRACEIAGPAYERLTDFFDLGTASMTSPAQVFLAVRRMLDALGTVAPVVLIIEDLHWADPSTLDLVRHLGQARKDDRRLLLVCTYRTREVSRDHPLWQLMAGATFLRQTERIELPAFTLEELSQFLGSVNSERADPQLVARCFEWSDGIAFYAEQLIAAGALENSEDVRVPPDMESVVLARLSGLSTDALKVLRVAAVAGRAMSRRLLRTVSDLPAEALHEAVQECFDRQMLIAGLEVDVYRFRHALLREAVYQATVRDTRVDLHVAMAEALASDPALSLTEGSATAEQASHWYQADVRPKALASAVQAGQLAARTLAFPSAEIQFGRALQLWRQVDDPEAIAGVGKVQLLIEAADAARWAGHVDRAVDHIRQAIEEETAGRRTDRLGELQERLATYLWEAGQSAESARAFHEAARLMAGKPPSAMEARVLAGIALAHLRAGRYLEGRAEADKALEMATEVGAPAEEGRALNISGLAMCMLGEQDGENRLRRSLDVAQSAHHIEDLFRAYGNLGLVLEHAGRLREAADVTKRGLEEARQLDLANTRQGTILANNSSAALVLLGEWDDAESIITEVSLDRPVAESLYPRLTLAEIKVARGDYDQARQLLASIAGVELGEDPRFLGPLHTIRAELALGEGDLDRAVYEVRCGLEAVRGTESALELLRLCAVGLRSAADQASRQGAKEQDRAVAVSTGDWLAREGWDAHPAPSTAETEQLVRLCKAERQRIRRADTAAEWSKVASGWTALDRPYPAAYARFRQAAAMVAAGQRSEARSILRGAHQATVDLRAESLRAKLAALAKRIDLDVDRAPRIERPYGLTDAEFDTLRLLADGNDAAKIAAERSVVRRTVETQLRAIYRKLDVHSGTEAVARAHKESLLD
ncbi:AAA family ATPase [Kribbella sp. VKM Ac-2569]|uniref:helix-turn-helix transcriptional regulator n=1 Tax=Kribbella sp. VKM Ac-2569 TaxID=2512220 RepID=UPI00102AA9D0|nr:AAA family ATPase [Kribbella sp. VKM Ac-2569]